jgi:hypothetical protein
VTGVAPYADSDGSILSGAFAENDRAEVEAIERSLAAGDTREAVLQCAGVVARLLRVDGADQAAAALLVGVDGAEWIRFQSATRVARDGGSISPVIASECFAFLLTTASRLAAI